MIVGGRLVIRGSEYVSVFRVRVGMCVIVFKGSISCV